MSSRDFLRVYDPDTNEPILIPYEDLDPQVLQGLIKPVYGSAFDANEFMRLPLPEVPFYIHTWLPKQGRLEVYGEDKAGKSCLAMQMARCIGSNEDFLSKKTEYGTVLYIQFELGERALQYRMQQTKKSYDNVFVWTTFNLKLDKTEGQDRLNQTINALRPDVVIIDPLYKTLSASEDDAQDLRVILDFFDQLLEFYRLSFVIMHHPGKDLTKGGRGSSILSGWHDSVIEFKRIQRKTPEEPQRMKLTPKLLRHAPLGAEYDVVMMQDFEFILCDAPQTAEQRLEAFFLKNRGRLIDYGLLEKGDFGARKTVYDSLKKLKERKVIVQPSIGKYLCPFGLDDDSDELDIP